MWDPQRPPRNAMEGEVPVRAGSSLEESPVATAASAASSAPTFMALRYGFMPASVEAAATEGVVELGSDRSATVTLHSASDRALYKGHSKPSLREYALVWDETAEEYVLERLTQTVVLKLQRGKLSVPQDSQASSAKPATLARRAVSQLTRRRPKSGGSASVPPTASPTASSAGSSAAAAPTSMSAETGTTLPATAASAGQTAAQRQTASDAPPAKRTRVHSDAAPPPATNASDMAETEPVTDTGDTAAAEGTAHNAVAASFNPEHEDDSALTWPPPAASNKR